MVPSRRGRILRGAAALLATRGWTKRGWFGPDGEACALGAVAAVADQACYEAAVWTAEVAGLAADEWVAISAFNDAPDTRVEDVQVLLLLLAEVADSQAEDRWVLASVRRQLQAMMGFLAPEKAPA